MIASLFAYACVSLVLVSGGLLVLFVIADHRAAAKYRELAAKRVIERRW